MTRSDHFLTILDSAGSQILTTWVLKCSVALGLIVFLLRLRETLSSKSSNQKRGKTIYWTRGCSLIGSRDLNFGKCSIPSRIQKLYFLDNKKSIIWEISLWKIDKMWGNREKKRFFFMFFVHVVYLWENELSLVLSMLTWCQKTRFFMLFFLSKNVHLYTFEEMNCCWFCRCWRDVQNIFLCYFFVKKSITVYLRENELSLVLSMLMWCQKNMFLCYFFVKKSTTVYLQ